MFLTNTGPEAYQVAQGGQGNVGGYPIQPQATPQPSQPERKRVSGIDIVGGLLDSIASMGGGEPMYQRTLDAQSERARQAEQDAFNREKFGLEKEKFGLDLRQAENEFAGTQREMFGKAYAGVKSLYDRYGADGVRRAAPRLQQMFGLSPEQTQMVADNPEESLMLLQGLAAGDKQAKFGTSLHAIVNPQTGETRWVQASEGGGVNPVDLPPGFQPDPRVQFLDNGYGYDPRSRNTGLPVAPIIPKTGDPSKGTQFGTDANGNPIIAPVQGGPMDQELNDKVTELRNLDNGLAALSDVFPSMLNNIEAMARAGSLSGVPADAVGVDGKPLRGGSTLGAMAYQNIPYLEQATNEQGFSAREQIMSQGMAAVNTIEPLLRQAQAGNVTLSSRMMDTPKELENLLKQVVNTKDYGAAMAAYNRFQGRYNEVRRDLAERIKKAESKTAAGRRSDIPAKITPPSGTKPSVSNW